TLDFDSDEISKYVTKKEKEENSLKNKLTQFFSGYSMALTSAKNQSNFDLISSYFKKNSSMYDKMKNSISNQQLVSLQSPQVLSASKSGDKILT
ncbi:TcaA NTF2-like domain-containing protein, partial [Staphylococcus intermedius]